MYQTHLTPVFFFLLHLDFNVLMSKKAILYQRALHITVLQVDIDGTKIEILLKSHCYVYKT
jgi:hypothetical protein